MSRIQPLVEGIENTEHDAEHDAELNAELDAELDNNVVLELKNKPHLDDYEGDFFELKDIMSTFYFPLNDIVGDDKKIEANLLDNRNKNLTYELTKEQIKNFDYGETKKISIRCYTINFGGTFNMTKYSGRLGVKLDESGKKIYTLKNKVVIGDFFEFESVNYMSDGALNKPFYYPYKTVKEGCKHGTWFIGLTSKEVFRKNLCMYLDHFSLGDKEHVHINFSPRMQKNIEGTFYLTKYYGKLDENIDEDGNITYTLIEKTGSNTKKLCNKLGVCTVSGGSKKRFKKTRKQRKHRKSKRNHKK
jgi:hypothetical protein